MQRAVHAFTVEDVIDVIVPLEQFHLRDLGKGTLNLLGRRANADPVDAEDADVQFLPIRPLSVETEQFRFTTRAAECGEAHSIQVGDHDCRAGFDLRR